MEAATAVAEKALIASKERKGITSLRKPQEKPALKPSMLTARARSKETNFPFTSRIMSPCYHMNQQEGR
jgi:hypothetical protein